MQDGTTKASLELKNERCITAFRISEEEQRMFKDYCLQHGSFMNPSGAQNPMYRNVLNVFKKFEIWQQMIFYCKPYSKATNEKKNRETGYGNNAGHYGETISRPTFLLKEKEKEIFLNGELTFPKQKIGFGEQGQTLKKTTICLKGLAVETALNQEALRNTYAIVKQGK